MRIARVVGVLLAVAGCGSPTDRRPPWRAPRGVTALDGNDFGDVQFFVRNGYGHLIAHVCDHAFQHWHGQITDERWTPAGIIVTCS